MREALGGPRLGIGQAIQASEKQEVLACRELGIEIQIVAEQPEPGAPDAPQPPYPPETVGAWLTAIADVRQTSAAALAQLTVIKERAHLVERESNEQFLRCVTEVVPADLGEIDPDVAATYLQEHPRATVYVDRAAAGELTRVKTPWMVGEVQWTRPLEIQAVIWLSQETGKSILRLDSLDYREHHLSSLLARYGNEPGLTIILFTLDETSYARELAPLAGHYPCLKLGPPWWFFDSPGGMRRFRELTTETAGFANTVGFNDDTRAFLSIPARHDLARRIDCGFLAELVAEHRKQHCQRLQLLFLRPFLPRASRTRDLLLSQVPIP